MGSRETIDRTGHRPGAGAHATTLEGILERVTYVNEENAWSVVRLAVPGKQDLVTVVGNLLGVQPGENLRLRGTALAAYFRCLADEASAEEYAREVDRVIEDFADHARPRHLAAARRAANAEQKAALRGLPARERRR